MGGDYAPNQPVLGAIQALPELPADARLVLFGDEKVIRDLFASEGADVSLVDIVHTTEVIGMAESATRGIPGKPDSSISRLFQYLKKGGIHSIAFAGNSGALMVGSTAALVILSLVIAGASGPLYELSERAARDLIDTSNYVDAVLGR